ncbi:hypothetical protein BAZMOX_01797_0 [methanotrophic endosymbiont of Bathymodiolus azoricus (Menez Gwen)]|nr:hypothetical protein BAZMOX_01797_0 [methanotrophic endosymbiont of Bathymodiolus azoricus (Menez Gwen)]
MIVYISLISTEKIQQKRQLKANNPLTHKDKTTLLLFKAFTFALMNRAFRYI